MRKTLLFLLFLSVKLAFGQFRDNFDDGDFTLNPTWAGQTTLFRVNQNKQLKTSISAVAQTVTLSTKNSLAKNVRFEFSLSLDFDPSSTNLVRIYLVSDQADLNRNLNGYFLQIGETGASDSYDLYRQTGSSIVKVIDGPPKNRSNPNYLSTKFRVTRDEFGKWELYSSDDGGANFVQEGSTVDQIFSSTQFFGIYCRYTATRSEGFTFDDFSVEELVADTKPPELLQISMIDSQTVAAVFSEALDPTSALLLDSYSFGQLGLSPARISFGSNAETIHFYFGIPLPTGWFSLTANKISDLNGNVSGKLNASYFYVVPYPAKKGDVVLNELFADPSPSVGLPGAEFVELWNQSDQYILLKGWKYKDATTTFTFGADTLAPHGYLILCPLADQEQFKRYGKVKGIAPWPSLNNDRDQLSLYNEQGDLIDEVVYNDTWYKDAIKKQGGYSLELIDPQNRCKGIQNWQGSLNPEGGSPGRQNSVFKQQLNGKNPNFLSVTVFNDTTVFLNFDTELDSADAAQVSKYHLNNGVGNPISVRLSTPDFKQIQLHFSQPLKKGEAYEVFFKQFCDCGGNAVQQSNFPIKIFTAKDAFKNDILITEVLFNPKPGGVDFVEIYNNTDHVLDLSRLALASVDAKGEISSQKIISSATLFLPERQFWILSTAYDKVRSFYHVENEQNHSNLPAFPAFSNASGTVVLVRDNELIDRFDYREDMHFSLLRDVKGVSLERISLERATNEVGNFRSSPQALGFATPGYKSSSSAVEGATDKIWLSAESFSPDGDGIDDVLQVNYVFMGKDLVASCTIFDVKGREIRRLLNNGTIPDSGSLVWDGKTSKGIAANLGIYVVKMEFFSTSGKRTKLEQVVALVNKLN